MKTKVFLSMFVALALTFSACESEVDLCEDALSAKSAVVVKGRDFCVVHMERPPPFAVQRIRFKPNEQWHKNRYGRSYHCMDAQR